MCVTCSALITNWFSLAKEQVLQTQTSVWVFCGPNPKTIDATLYPKHRWPGCIHIEQKLL